MKGIFARYSTQIFFVMLVLGLVPTISIMVFLYTEETSIKEAELSKSLLFTSESVSNKISNWIEERESNIIDIATSKLMVESTHEITQTSVDERRKSEIKYTLEKISNIVMNNQHWIKELAIIDPISNKIIYHSDLYLPKNLPQEGHYLDALEGRVGISEIHRSPRIIENEVGEYQKDLPTMWFSSPIKGEVGIKGILSVRADVFQIDTAPPFGSVGSEDFDVYVVNGDGNVITKPTLSQATSQKINSNQYTELRLINQESNEFTKIFHMANKEKTAWLLEPYQNHFGDMVIGSISPIKNTDWYVISELNAHAAFSNILKTQIILVTFTILLILLIIGLMTYFTTKLVMPLKDLEKVTHQIEKGNLEVKVEVEGPTEIRNLSHSFAAMVSSLKNSILSQINAERKYRLLYEQAPTMNRSIDTNGIITDCNDMYATKLGYKKEEMIGKSIFEFYDKADLPKMQDLFNEWKKTGIVSNREVRLKTKDGTLFPVIMNASNLYDKDGNIVGSNTILQDLSDLKKMELELLNAQERAKRAKLVAIGELASRVAHDIRNPLSVINAQTQTAKPTRR
jgi:PAS domain S-box-containing protein